MGQIKRGLGKFIFSDRNLQRFVDAVTENINSWRGDKGSPKDKVVTVGDLVALGVATIRGSGALGLGGTIGSALAEQDLTVPPQPTGLSAAGAWSNVILDWDPAPFSNYSYTELWRSDTDDLGAAVQVGTSVPNVFTDSLGTGETKYYWIRFVSKAGVKGPFNATAGTVATTALVAESNFASTITPVELLGSLPSNGDASNFDGRTAYVSGVLYKYVGIPGSGGQWISATDWNEISGSNKPQDFATASTTENLIFNGDAEFGSAAGFGTTYGGNKTFEWQATGGRKGGALLKYTYDSGTPYASVFGDHPVPVDVNKFYEYAAAAKCDLGGSQNYFGYACLNESKQIIYPHQCWWNATTETTFYEAASQYATSVKIVPPASGWYDPSVNPYSFLRINPDDTVPGSIGSSIKINTITDNGSYWTLDLDFGIPVAVDTSDVAANSHDGSTFNYSLWVAESPTIGAWEYRNANIGGYNDKNTAPSSYSEFRYGTKYIVPLLLINYNQVSGETLYVDDLRWSETKDWSLGISGTNKPEDNATFGGTMGHAPGDWNWSIGTLTITNNKQDIEKTGGVDTTWDAGCASGNDYVSSGDCTVQFTIPGNRYLMAGLVGTAFDGTYSTIDYALYRRGTTATYEVYENGTLKYTSGVYGVDGDVCAVRVRNGAVEYVVNNVVIYTSLVSPTYPLRPGASFYHLNAKITDTWFSGNVTGQVQQGMLAPGTVGVDELLANSIVAGKIAAGAIVAGDGVISNAAIQNAQIANLAVDTAKLGNLAVTNAKVANLAIDAAKMANATITNAKIANGTITNAKMGSASIATANIIDANVTTLKVAGGAITASVSLELSGSDPIVWNANLASTTGYVTVATTSMDLGPSGATPSTILTITKQLGIKIWQHASNFNYLTCGFTARVVVGSVVVAYIYFNNIEVTVVNGAYQGEYFSNESMIIDTTSPGSQTGNQTVYLQIACTYWNSSGGPWLTVKCSTGFFCYLQGAKR
jgi:hypothetical protein